MAAGPPVRSGLTVLLWATVAVKGVQLLYFWVKGLGWAGFWYHANLVQGLVFLVLAVVLAMRRRVFALLVPLLSFGLGVGFRQADLVMTERACSPEARAAVAELGQPYVVDNGDPFTYTLAFGRGCAAVFPAPAAPTVVLENYRRGALAAGWELTGRQSADRVEASNERWTVEVTPYPPEEGLLELLVHPRTS